jgi:hypothetical protein
VHCEGETTVFKGVLATNSERVGIYWQTHAYTSALFIVQPMQQNQKRLGVEKDAVC